MIPPEEDDTRDLDREVEIEMHDPLVRPYGEPYQPKPVGDVPPQVETYRQPNINLHTADAVINEPGSEGFSASMARAAAQAALAGEPAARAARIRKAAKIGLLHDEDDDDSQVAYRERSLPDTSFRKWVYRGLAKLAIDMLLLFAVTMAVAWAFQEAFDLAFWPVMSILIAGDLCAMSARAIRWVAVFLWKDHQSVKAEKRKYGIEPNTPWPRK